jgi:hypothetical protein
MNATFGFLAEFSSPSSLLTAAKKIHAAGYTHFDCHSPFPIHGMDAAMGLKRSPLGYIVGIMTILGALTAFGLQTWVTTSAYPLIFSGKAYFSWQAYIVITFALFVLFGTFGAVFGMFHINKLPTLHHPLFNSEQFKKVTDDGFFVSIEAADGLFDEAKTRAFLEALGGRNIELVKHG